MHFMNHALDPTIVIAPDSFKGSLDAAQVAAAISAGLIRALPRAKIRQLPMADGGEGTLDALLSRGGQRIELQARDATGQYRPVPAARLHDSGAALETAHVVSITDPIGMAVAARHRTTLGMGDAITALLDDGARRILVALGGSSTNDGGAGLLVALGVRLFDAAGETIPATPDGLGRLARIDLSGLDPRLSEVEIIAMSDVDNPLIGERGAIAVFGPQKGVMPGEIEELDRNLDHFAQLLSIEMQRDLRHAPGAGAAGGLGYALQMLGARFKAGAEIVAEEIELDLALGGADWLITGEGRSDRQTLSGKAPFIACQHATRLGVPTSLLSGAIDRHALPELGRYFAGCFSPAPGPITLETAIADAASLLSDAAEQLARARYARGA
jgi:glycerate kinase